MRANIQDLRAFVATADHESFHQAAHVLHITQSALSRRLQKLEEVLGARLLDRTSRTMRLTAVGEAFLNSARSVIAHMDQALADIEDFVELRAGTISISCTRTLASTVIPRAARRFGELYPDVKVRIIDDIGPGTVQAVLNGEAEFGVVLIDNASPNVEPLPVLSDPFVLACPFDHPLLEQPQVRWSELSEHRFLRLATGTGNERVLSAELGPRGLLPDWSLEAKHVSTLIAMIENGLGVAAVPRITIGRFRGARIAIRPLVDPEISRRIGILDAPGRSLSPAAVALRGMVLEEMRHFGAGGDTHSMIAAASVAR